MTSITTMTPGQKSEFLSAMEASGLAGAPAMVRARTADWRTAMPKRIRAQEVMASPPTITYTTTNPLAAAVTGGTARFIPSVQEDGARTPNAAFNPLFRYRKAGNVTLFNTGFPGNLHVRFGSVNAGDDKFASRVGIPLITDAPRVVMYISEVVGQLAVKVNGQYISLTPQALANTGNGLYFDMDFGSSALREIEFIAYGNLRFIGLYLSSTATVMTAPPRGPRGICLGDSFGGDTGSASILNSMFMYMADCLGLDDVWPSAVGSTGLLAAPAPRLTYRQRIATDVIPFAPDFVMVWLSINDSTFTPAALVAEATLLIDALRASLPNLEIIFAGPGSWKGSGFCSVNMYNIGSAFETLCAAKGCKFINLLEQPLLGEVPLTNTTTTASVSGNATSVVTARRLCPGATYKFNDGTHFVVKSVGGTDNLTATVDRIINAQASGATVTQCGPNIWQGDGRVGATTGFGNCDLVVGTDGAHPTDAGHVMIGTALAYGVMRVLGGQN